MRGLLAALLFCFAGPLCPAQEPPSKPSRGAWVFFEREIELPVLLRACSDAIGAPIEYDPSKISGTITVQSGQQLSASELWDLANRELFSRGFASVQPPQTQAVRIVPLADAPSLARLENPTLDGAVAGFIRVLVPLSYRQAETLVDPVKQLLSKNAGTCSAIKDSNALLVADLKPQVVQVLTALALLDAPGLGPELEEVGLKHTSPASVASLVERVLAARKQVTGETLKGTLLPLADSQSVLIVAPPAEMLWWERNVERFDAPQQATTEEYRPRRFGLAETARLLEQVVHDEASIPWRLVKDELTGTLVISTTPSLHEEVRAALARLESTAAGATQPMRAYPIKNRRVSEVLGLLQELLAAGVLEKSAPTPAAPASPQTPRTLADGTGGPFASTKGGDVTIAADPGTNRLIAFGEARMLDQLELLIRELDVRHAQVLVEALVINLTESQTQELGVELRATGTSSDAIFQLGSLFGLGSTNPAGSSLPLPTGTGFSGAVLSPGDWSAVVHALELTSQGRTLTIPKVLVQNNQEATLDSVLQTPYASTNASNTVATTSFGGTLDAGTTIAVKPQVADGDRIVLEYTVSLSSFVGASANPSLPPPRKQDKLKSVVAIPDGYTVVVGGLEVNAQTDGASHVPLLGQIPILGALFRSQSKLDSKARLFVFLRCTAVGGESYEDLRFASGPAKEAAGIPEDWPRLEPRVMR